MDKEEMITKILQAYDQAYSEFAETRDFYGANHHHTKKKAAQWITMKELLYELKINENEKTF